MAMRRPRIKVAANLSIRRPTKAAASSGEFKPVDSTASPTPSDREKQEQQVVKPETVETGEKIHAETLETEKKQPGLKPVSTPSPVATQSAFKFPKPVEELPRHTTPAPVPHYPLEVNTDEPHSPKKLDSKFAYINALNSPRKRIRTESMTSNKSYSDVSLKSRKTIKQEESQKASDAKRDLRKRLNNIQNIDKQSLTMFDMIYYNPVKNPMKSPALSKKGSLENIPRMVDRESRSVSKSRSPTPAPMMPPPEAPSAPSTQPTPQIKLGPNGEMILDEASLVIENEREKALRDSMAKAEIVYVDEFSGNSGYYSRYKRTRDWPPEETIRFYRCLHTIGTDFSMMIQLFPNRSRRDLKLKFKKEERLNLKLVNKALLFPKEFNIEELQQQFQEEDEEIERIREQERQEKAELDEKLKQQKMAKKMQLNQSKSRNPKKRVSKSERVMLNMDRLGKTEPLVKEVKPKRKKRKVAQKNAHQQEAEASVKRKTSKTDVPEPCPSVDVEDDVFDDTVEGSNDESNREVRVSQIDSVPYIPNGGFEQLDNAPSSIESTEHSRSPLDSTPPSNESPVEAISSESQLDINAMDIDIVDEESRNLYEIKAEPKTYPVQIYESDTNGSMDTQNVITLQNMDDQSQTTVTYREPAAMVNSNQRSTGSDQDVGIDSIESKYYGGCDVVYLPMPANAPIAHPVKTETSYYPSQQMLIPTPIPSPPLVYDLHSITEPTAATSPVPSTPLVKPDVKEGITSEESNSATTNPSPTPLEPKSEKEPIEPLLEDSNGVQESETSEDLQPSTEASEEAGDEPDEEPRGLGPLEDIDINSLVLVESQDTTNPGKTIYEIYVIDPETGKLSEKPLDVPEDVIENIRSILEAGED
ncbi:uncharacterized protein Bdp1 [Ochlerotatus camptorhynchus]|uniref:uncharacterized protein Bdp1 n=1 Tax=Ochlerotatus camptorhynchus TaxID=644619 RepID=UPI0031D4BA2E